VDRNHRMELQYDGTGLHGWAKQNGVPTVEGCLEDAFRAVLGAAPALRVAGRTDAGVHARRQVVSFALPDGQDLYKLRRSLNALTPDGISVLDVRPAPAAFDARCDATSRIYRYFVCPGHAASPFWRGYCWRVLGCDLDLAAMSEAAALVTGRHHFTAFTPTETEHTFFDRTVLRCRWSRPAGGGPGGSIGRPGGGVLCLEIEADAFLRHMVRALVGTMVDVGRGERSLGEFARLLDDAPREAAGVTAPPDGLFLWDIKYGRGGSKRLRSSAAAYGKIPAEDGGAAAGSHEEQTADSEA
jgi:tRNA pseudouridine38-40 synthase